MEIPPLTAGAVRLPSLLLALAACTRSPNRLPEPEWVRESPLAAAPVETTVWPDSAWSTGAPASVGISEFALDSAARVIPATYPEVRALLVVVDGRLVFERHFGGDGPADPIEIKSVTKSIVSALVGIALARGELASLDDPIVRWLAADTAVITDPAVRRITLRHALTMTAGLRWRENGPETVEWMRSDNQVQYLLRTTLDSAPGIWFNYNSGLAHLVGVALARAVGTDLATYADRMLFAPIGIRAGPWGTDRQGNHEGGSELQLTARDLARFGLLILNRGRWNDRQVVPEAWVLESTRPHGRVDYGYLWSYLPKEWGGPAVNALGYGGQIISIVPDANAVIVIGSTIANPENPVLGLVREALIPAVRHRR